MPAAPLYVRTVSLHSTGGSRTGCNTEFGVGFTPQPSALVTAMVRGPGIGVWGMTRSVRPLRFAMAVAVVALVALGLSACVADPPPTIGTATPGDGQAVVSWQPPLAAPVPITAYVVTPWIGSGQTPVVFNSTATTQTVTGLTNGVTYTFTVPRSTRGDDSAGIGHVKPGHADTDALGMYGWGDNYSGQLGDGWVTTARGAGPGRHRHQLGLGRRRRRGLRRRRAHGGGQDRRHPVGLGLQPRATG